VHAWGWAGYGAASYYGWGSYLGAAYFPTYPYYGAYSDGTAYWNGYPYGTSYWSSYYPYGAYYYGFKQTDKATFMSTYKSCTLKIASFCDKSVKSAEECQALIEKNYEAVVKAGCPSKETSSKCSSELTALCGQVKDKNLPTEEQLQCVETNRNKLAEKGCELPPPNAPEFAAITQHHRAKDDEGKALVEGDPDANAPTNVADDTPNAANIGGNPVDNAAKDNTGITATAPPSHHRHGQYPYTYGYYGYPTYAYSIGDYSPYYNSGYNNGLYGGLDSYGLYSGYGYGLYAGYAGYGYGGWAGYWW
jgi:hypothetical protein